MQKLNWHTFTTPDEVAKAAYRHILSIAASAIEQHGTFKIVLAGGSTPEKVYQLLAESEADWSHWHIYFGDERCLPSDHEDRNSVMAARALLEKVAIPAEQIHAIPAELGPEAGAKAYRKMIADVEFFDLVLLGMGEDGHTASLFPGHEHNLEETVHAVYHSPKPPPERVSLSAATLSNADEGLFLVTGSGKQEAVEQWRQGVYLPVTQIKLKNAVAVYVDEEAMGYS